MVATAFRHIPVMVERATELLRPRPGGIYVDATLGLGGHSERLLELSAPDGRVIGIDRDPVALETARARLAAYGDRLEAVRASHAELADVLAALGIDGVDGVLYDLGVSSLQLDDPERGFSYRHEAPLDMRMDPGSSVTAADIVNSYPRAELVRVLREYGEERFAGRIAQFIEQARRRREVRTTAELVDIIKAAVPASARRTGPHPARRTFQALRVEVNAELGALRDSLPTALDALRPEARIVVISYHSLEDRIVKRVFAEAARGDYSPPELPEHVVHHVPTIRVLTRRPETPSATEVAVNPRSESAKLRAAEKLAAGAGSAGAGSAGAGPSRRRPRGPGPGSAA